MEKQGYVRIPPLLCHWITYLCQVFPARSIKTFIELLFGSMLSSSGFVCQALLHIQYGRDWTAYYKWIERGQWSWLALARQMAGLVIRWFDEPVWHLIVDDTLVLRASRKAPGVAVHHPHGSKVNQPDYVRAQCWVALAVTVGRQAIPLLMRLAGTGNHGKLATAQSLLRVMAGYFRPARLLVDCWYMRGWLIDQVLAMGLEVIGQVRIDTALFDVPGQTGKRGRPRKYGARIEFDQWPEQRLWLELYGQEQWVRIRSGMAAARFLHGRVVRGVWTQFERADGRLTQPRLILSTETGLSGEQILAAYARRWSIEILCLPSTPLLEEISPLRHFAHRPVRGATSRPRQVRASRAALTPPPFPGNRLHAVMASCAVGYLTCAVLSVRPWPVADQTARRISVRHTSGAPAYAWRHPQPPSLASLQPASVF